MRALQAFICGFSPVFSGIIFIMILLFIWPVPLSTFYSPPYYLIWDSQVAILLTATFCGILWGLFAVILDDYYNSIGKK